MIKRLLGAFECWNGVATYIVVVAFGMTLVQQGAAAERNPVEAALQVGFGGFKPAPATLSFSPDGKFVVSGSQDGYVKIWETSTGRLVRTIWPGSPDVVDVTVAGDGKTLRVCTYGGRLTNWNMASARMLGQSEPIDELGIDSTAASPRRFAVAGSVTNDRDEITNMVDVWDRENLVRVARLRVGVSIGQAFAISHDDQTVCVMSLPDAGKTRGEVWNIQSGARVAELALDGAISLCTFDSSNQNLIVATDEGQIASYKISTGVSIWSVKNPNAKITLLMSGSEKITAGMNFDLVFFNPTSGQELGKLPVHGEINALALNSSNTQMAVSVRRPKRNGAVIDLRNNPSGAWTREISAPDQGVIALAYTKNGDAIFSGSVDERVRMWNARTGTLSKAMSGHIAAVRGLAVSPDGTVLASCSYGDAYRLQKEGEVVLWDAVSGEMQQTLLTLNHGASCVAFSNSGKLFGVGGVDGSIRVWSVPQWSRTVTFENDVNPLADFRVFALTFRSDDRRIIYSQEEKGIVQRDLNSGDIIWRIGGSATFATMSISGDERIFAAPTPMKQGEISIFDTESGVSVRQIRCSSDAVTALQFLPGQHMVLAGTEGGTCYLVDADTGTVVKELPRHEGAIRSFACSTNSKLVAVGSDDNSIGFVSIGTGKRVASFHSPLGSSEFLSYTPKSHFVASPAGERLVFFRKGLQLDMAGRYHGSFYNPNMVMRALEQ
jgi:WD40 repeat protein